MQTKIVAALMVGFVALMVVPILNLAERTSVQGRLNELLTQQNTHIFNNRQTVMDILTKDITDIVGEDAKLEIIMYHYTGTVPMADLEHPEDVPGLEGITRTAAYFEVSALVARVFWVQKKLRGTIRDPDGYPIGSCYYCEDDARAQRVVFVPANKMDVAFARPPGDLDFVQNPALLFD